LPSNKLESTKENTNANSDSIREKKRLAKVTNGVCDARLIGTVIAGRRVEVVMVMKLVVSMSSGASLTALKLLDCVSETLLCFAKTALGVGIVGDRRRRRRGRCHGELSLLSHLKDHF
jgi:hypothetical protein